MSLFAPTNTRSPFVCRQQKKHLLFHVHSCRTSVSTVYSDRMDFSTPTRLCLKNTKSDLRLPPLCRGRNNLLWGTGGMPLHCAARHCVAWRGSFASILTFATPFLVRPICLAAACERSRCRPGTYGPRSLIFTWTDWPVSRLVTVAFVPKRQRPMGSGQGVLIERLAARCFSAMETRSIPGGRPDLGGRRFAVREQFLLPVGQAQERPSRVRGGQTAVARALVARLHPARHPSNVTPTMHPHASGVCTRDMVDSSSVTLVQGARLMPCRSRADEAISASVTRKEEAAQGRLPAQACGLRACHREGTEQPWHSTGRIGRWRVAVHRPWRKGKTDDRACDKRYSPSDAQRTSFACRLCLNRIELHKHFLSM